MHDLADGRHIVILDAATERVGQKLLGHHADEYIRAVGEHVSQRDWAIYLADLTYRGSVEMLHSLKTGEPAFPQAFGAPLFDYLSAHPEYATKLFRAMSSISAARVAGLLETYDFSGTTKLIDVGGAHGAMAAAIAKRYATIRCTCFDLPNAEQGALKTLGDDGVTDRCDFVAGDFFEDIPAGADTYLLSAV